MMYKFLTEDQKRIFKSYCDKTFGPTEVKTEEGEPIYFTTDQKPIPNEFILRLLFDVLPGDGKWFRIHDYDVRANEYPQPQ